MTDFGTSTNFTESVNICLMALGERAITSVSSLTPTQGQNTVVNLCLRVLDEVNKDVEARGWWFQSSRGAIIGITNGTPAWHADHPEEFRRYVTIRSARILQTRYITDETLHKLTLEEEIYSKAVLEAKDAQQDSSVTFDLPQAIENLGIREVMFLQSNMEEKLATLKLGTELQQTSLVEKQVAKTTAEELLIDAQELLVDQQKLTEVNTTTKVLREGELLAAQELKTDAEKLLVDEQVAKTTAETALIADQEALVVKQALTEVAKATDIGADTTLKGKQGLLVDAQELKTDAETTLTTKQGLLVDAQELKTDAETTLTTKQGLLIDSQELKTDAETTLTTKQGALVDAQELKTDAETTLTTKQGALVDSQELKTDAEKLLVDEQTSKTTSEKALIDSQELKTDAEKLLVDAQAALTADQELKIVSETGLLDSQKTKLDAETAYMVTAEKNWFDTGGVDISGTVRSYKDFRPEMRIMGIQEAPFQSLPAYKKVELIKDAVQLRTDRASSDTATNIVSSVNKILRYLGVNKVSSNTNEHALASEARDLLIDTDKELQARGWWFNTEKDVTFTITSGTIRVTPNTQLYEELDDYPTARVVDGAYIVLKNLTDNTVDQFSGTIKGTRVVKRSIEELEVPQKYREYLEIKVAAILAELYPQSGSEIQRIRKQEAELETYFKDRENDQGNYNIFDNYDTAERIGFNRNYDLN